MPQHMGMYPRWDGCTGLPCRFSVLLYKCRNRVRRHRSLRAAIPISVLFVIMQKFYVEGITSGADKG